MKRKIAQWILKHIEDSENPLLQKISKSLQRDIKLPFSHLVRKAFLFFESLLFARLYLRKCDKVGKRPRTRRKPYIENAGKIEIGNNANINSKNVQTDLVTGPDGVLKIGDDANINFGVSIVANNKVQVGDNIRIGPYTMIYDTDVHIHGKRFIRAPGEPVIIEDGVWLASRTMVLKGSLIGKGSIIAAGAVVSGIIPPYVVAGGVPAKVIRYLDPPADSDFSWDENSREKEVSDLVIKRVKRVVSKVMSVSFEVVDLSWAPDDVEQWDSFTHVELMKALETEFKISLRPKDTRRMINVGKICKVIDDYLCVPVETV